MLNAAADLAQIGAAAPWAAVALLCLTASAWVYRQTRRAVVDVRLEAAGSAARQGKRLGELEKVAGLLDLRRRQVEWVLLDLGIPLPLWPPDGPDQPRPRARRDVDEDQADDVDEDQADEQHPGTEVRRIPVPPLDHAGAARHRR